MAGDARNGALPLTRRQLVGGISAGAFAPAVVRSQSLGSQGHAVVVGAGVFGSWTANALRERGLRVTLVDAQGPAHSRASSGGESRMTRAGYGKDEVYTRMALESLSQWKRLSERSALPLFHPHGVLFFFAEEIDYFRDTLAIHEKLGLPTESLTAAQMAARFPMIDFDGVAGGLLEPEFGALMARRAVQELVRRLVSDGVEWRKGVAAPMTMPRGPIALQALQLADGSKLEGDRFIFACGPWLPKLFPDILERRIVATRQEIFFFAPPAGDPRFGPAVMPGWADFSPGGLHYGFPDLEARGVKFALDDHGPEVDPDANPREASAAALAEIIAFRDRRFPLLKGAPLTEARVCQYENSSSGDYLIDRHPGHTNVTLVGAGSGHGFKNGPAVGRIAASIALGVSQDEPRFTLAAKEKTQARSVI